MESNGIHAPTEEYRAELASKGQSIYDSKLRPILEPDHIGEYVVIHIDSGDYALGRSITAAYRAIRERQALDGRLIGLRIGNEPQFGLASRIFDAQQNSSKLA